MTDLHEERVFAIEELLPAFLAQAQKEKHFFHGAHRKSDIHIVTAAHVAFGVHKARLNEHQKTGFGQKNLLIALLQDIVSGLGLILAGEQIH